MILAYIIWYNSSLCAFHQIGFYTAICVLQKQQINISVSLTAHYIRQHLHEPSAYYLVIISPNNTLYNINILLIQVRNISFHTYISTKWSITWIITVRNIWSSFHQIIHYIGSTYLLSKCIRSVQSVLSEHDFPLNHSMVFHWLFSCNQQVTFICTY